ncbi:probable E3 ubiquitin-protein ligase HIP1 [Selaginella moellendorffii]|uniref:probable E3 ubiquitin-protein ligase HIP1 n=1 Tax=Selaginella moellendorffii TaxID=88036 RepID=UPI000D1C833A|nr:probable E3 ubiquitin-protein ligase HIP1 [Selaginella moellendorffii]|eukprot:XP_024538578.1 probable E3 ubiquitin-protein ligase HIP1 [Selaginella moellendorffii]
MNRSAAQDSTRNERSIGKGRRRRAAAEQRRIEQQRWGQFDEDKDEDGATDLILAPAPRRRSRRPSRRELLQDELQLARDELEMEALRLRYGGSHELDIALALSLSLSDEPTYAHAEATAVSLDMSYESLVELESVKCVASPALVASLDRTVFSDGGGGGSADSCVICQNEYVGGDNLSRLPCKHDVHEACGSEWLLNYSKLCPVCKADVTMEH